MARIRETIRRGAPRTTDEARQLMAIVRECFPGAPSEWEGRLSAALTEILVGTVLHQPTYEARAHAVEALDAMERDLRKM
ncbi:MAG TPA: hypothetical protein VNS34_03580 [Rhizobiaceae bacterium]|nr:hypothetical protein [Rhizobiaceae bacterium]